MSVTIMIIILWIWTQFIQIPKKIKTYF